MVRTADALQQPHILVVDDDPRLKELLRKYLSEHGFVVTTASQAEEARTAVSHIAFDAMVLDVMMPGESGMVLAGALRKKNLTLPILMLTAKGEVTDRITGLEAGVDDYLPKPFEPKELVLRLNAILRRTRPPETPAEVRFGPWTFDLKLNKLSRGQEHIPLTTTEASLLHALASPAGQTLAREQLATQLGLEGQVRTVDVQVARLRRKIEDNPRVPRYLQTVRGQGYMLWANP